MNSSAFGRRARGGRAPRRKKFQFGGQSGQNYSSSYSSTTTDPGYGTPYINLRNNVLQTANNFLDQPFQPYNQQRFAGFTPDQQQAMQAVRSAQGNWSPFTNQAATALGQAQGQAGGVGTAGAGAFGTAQSGPTGTGASTPYFNRASQSWTDPGIAQSWMNPYTQDVTNATAQQATQAFMGPGGALQGLTDAFTGGGAAQFGRERMGDVAGQMTTAFGRGLGQSLASVNQQGYNQGMQGFQNQQQLLGNLGTSAGNLATGQMGAFTNLGSAQTNAALQGVNALTGVASGQQNLGSNVQQNTYRDISALGGIGQQEQQFNQQGLDFGYAQNQASIQWPMQMAQLAQSLGGGWQLPQNTTSQSYGWSGQTQPSGSIAGNVMGGLTSLAGLATPGAGGTSPLGNIFGANGLGWVGSSPGIGKSHGGTIKRRQAFGAGGYAPVVQSLRSSQQRRQPAQMQRVQAIVAAQQGAPGPGMPLPLGTPMVPGGQPGKGAPPKPPGPPQQAFAKGGKVSDDVEDKKLVRKGVWQHERKMHGVKKRSQLTPLKLSDGGWLRYVQQMEAPKQPRQAFASGGDTGDSVLDDMGYQGAFLRSRLPAGYGGDYLPPQPGDPRGTEMDTRSWGRRAFDTARDVADGVGSAFGDAGRRWIHDPGGSLAATARIPSDAVDLARHFGQGSIDAATRIASRYMHPELYERDPLGAAIETGWDASELNPLAGMAPARLARNPRRALSAFAR